MRGITDTNKMGITKMNIEFNSLESDNFLNSGEVFKRNYTISDLSKPETYSNDRALRALIQRIVSKYSIPLNIKYGELKRAFKAGLFPKIIYEELKSFSYEDVIKGINSQIKSEAETLAWKKWMIANPTLDLSYYYERPLINKALDEFEISETDKTIVTESILRIKNMHITVAPIYRYETEKEFEDLDYLKYLCKILIEKISQFNSKNLDDFLKKLFPSAHDGYCLFLGKQFKVSRCA